MKKLCIAGGLIALLLLPICTTLAVAAGKDDLAPLESTAAFDFVTLAKSSSTSVTADIGFPLAFKFIPILLVGDGTGAFSANLSGAITASGELIYIYQRFPGVPVSDFNIGITPLTGLNTSTAVTLGPGYAMGYVITGILFSPEPPPYKYRLSLSFN